MQDLIKFQIGPPPFKMYLFQLFPVQIEPEAEFKEFEPRFKYAWFHLKLYQMFQDSSRRLILTGFLRI